MKTLKELSDKLEKFDNLPKEEKNNILELIDLKTELDMKEIIMEIRNMESKFETRFSAIDSKFNGIDSKFSGIDSKFNILLWVVSAIGLMIAIIGLMIAVFKFIG